jgi:hypothetical protein
MASYGNLLCASGYGGEIIVINTNTRAKKKHLLKSKSTVTALMFLSKNKLLSANVDGEIHIYSLVDNTTKKLVTTLHNIKQILYVKKSNSLLVCANTNYIALIDLNKEVIVNNKFKLFEDIVQEISLLPQDTLLVKLKNSQKKSLKLNISTSNAPVTQEISPSLNRGGETELLQAYDANDFKQCYELIDKYNLDTHQLAILLEKHWEKLIQSCEEFALKGDAKSIISTFKELLFIQTRSEKIGDLLRLSFFQKIKILSEEKLYQSAMNIIYSYIDIFGYDREIAMIIKKFELHSKQKIAIFRDSEDRRSRACWRSYFHQLN